MKLRSLIGKIYYAIFECDGVVAFKWEMTQEMEGYKTHAGRGHYFNVTSCLACTLWAIGPVPVLCYMFIIYKETIGKILMAKIPNI